MHGSNICFVHRISYSYTAYLVSFFIFINAITENHSISILLYHPLMGPSYYVSYIIYALIKLMIWYRMLCCIYALFFQLILTLLVIFLTCPNFYYPMATKLKQTHGIMMSPCKKLNTI